MIKFENINSDIHGAHTFSNLQDEFHSNYFVSFNACFVLKQDDSSLKTNYLLSALKMTSSSLESPLDAIKINNSPSEARELTLIFKSFLSLNLCSEAVFFIVDIQSWFYDS